MPEPQYMSRSKLAELRAELAELRTVRNPAVARQINLARTSGSGDGNAEPAVARQINLARTSGGGDGNAEPAVARQINLARTGGGEGNAEQELARQELAFVEGKMRALANLIGNAVVADLAGEGAVSAGKGADWDGEGADSAGEGADVAGEGAAAAGVVGLWRTVTVERENGQQVQYQITGSAEADPGRGKISHVSPIGKRLMGKKAGDIAEAPIPSGGAKLKIVSVR